MREFRALRVAAARFLLLFSNFLRVSHEQPMSTTPSLVGAARALPGLPTVTAVPVGKPYRGAQPLGGLVFRAA